MVKSTIDRIAGIVKSNVNELLDQIENPEKMVRQMIRDMDEAVDAAVATMCTAVANQRRLEPEHANNTAKAGEFQQKANRAVASGDDELGRLYLERKTQYDRTAEDQGSALAESRRTADKLRDNLQSLRSKLQDARNRQGTLVARCQAARARGSLIAKSPSTSGSDPFSRFGQLEQRIAEHEGEFERLKQQVEFSEAASQAEAEVRRELDGASRAADRSQDLETQQRVADELEKLRLKVGQKEQKQQKGDSEESQAN